MKSGRPKKTYVPDRGDIVYVNFSPDQGHEQGYARPAIILSPLRYNRVSSLALMCPITSQAKGYGFEVLLSEGMKTTGVVLSDQVKSFDWKARAVEFVEKAPPGLTEEVLAKLEVLLE